MEHQGTWPRGDIPAKDHISGHDGNRCFIHMLLRHSARGMWLLLTRRRGVGAAVETLSAEHGERKQITDGSIRTHGGSPAVSGLRGGPAGMGERARRRGGRRAVALQYGRRQSHGSRGFVEDLERRPDGILRNQKAGPKPKTLDLLTETHVR